MSKWIITVLSFSVLFTSYFAYNCWKDEKTAKAEVKTQKEKVKELKNEISKMIIKQKSDNEAIAKNEQIKIKLENESIKQQEQINELLKNDKCANEFVPSAYIDRLYNRANQIRQSANTSQSIK